MRERAIDTYRTMRDSLSRVAAVFRSLRCGMLPLPRSGDIPTSNVNWEHLWVLPFVGLSVVPVGESRYV